MEKTRMSHKAGKTLFVIFILAFLVSPALTLRLSPHTYEGGRSKNVNERRLRNRSAPAIILGEIRSSMSDIMFIKTELYLHSGVAYKLNLDYEAMSSKGEVREINEQGAHVHDESAYETHETTDHAHEHEHDHEVPPGEEDLHFHCEGADTVIRSREKDFRGFIGDLHREVKPWLDPSKPHLHSHGTELLPWYRLMTLSDPHNVRGYMIGAWWLKRLRKKPQLMEARKFLEEGIKYNPEAFQLYLMHGHIMRALEDNPAAKESYQKAADFAIRQRPPGGKTGPHWTHYNDEDALASVRLAVLMEKEFGKKEKALELARHYLENIGEDLILERQIEILSGDPGNP